MTPDDTLSVEETKAPAPKAGRPKDSVKRQEIVVAATQLFLQHGFELTSMEAVARQAGVSKLTIYSHFTDKNDLFRAIMQNRCVMVGMPDSFAAEAEMSAEAALLKIGRHVLSLIYQEDSVRLQRVIYAEAVRQPELAKIFYSVGPQRVREAFIELLRSFDRQGKVAMPDPARAAEQFFSLLKGERLMRTLMMLFPIPTAEELDAHVQATVSFFLKAYRPSPTEPS